jgi:hypothetical protein
MPASFRCHLIAAQYPPKSHNRRLGFQVVTSSSQKIAFKQRFLAQTSIRPENFNREVLRRTLPLHARVVLPAVTLIKPDVLSADYDLIEDIALLTSRRDFSASAGIRRFHPANRGFLRKVLRIRVSISKLRDLVYDVMRPRTGADSTPPFRD